MQYTLLLLLFIECLIDVIDAGPWLVLHQDYLMHASESDLLKVIQGIAD